MIKLNDVKVVFEKFPNGESRISQGTVLTNKSKEEVYFKYEDDSDLIKLLLLKNYIDDLSDAKTNLIITYMPYSRMDRSENKSPFTLKYISKLINSMNFNEVTVVEPHSNVSTALLDKVTPYFANEDLIEEVISLANIDINKDYIMYPDAGASSRYKNFKYPNVIIGNKTRDFTTGEIKGLELIGEFNKGGKKALIIDDLSSYGGTFIHSAKALKEKGIDEVYLLVAHAENSVFKGELFNHIEHLFTTDSIISEEGNWENKKFEPQLTIFNLHDIIKNKKENGGF